MKLIIMFLVGLGITLGTYFFVLHDRPITAESFNSGIPMIVGFVLMLIAGVKGLKKFNNYLDK